MSEAIAQPHSVRHTELGTRLGYDDRLGFIAAQHFSYAEDPLERSMAVEGQELDTNR